MQKNLFFSDVTKAEFVATMHKEAFVGNEFYIAHQEENGEYEYRYTFKRNSNFTSKTTKQKKYCAYVWLHIYPVDATSFFQEADTCKEHLEADSAEELYDLLKQWHKASEL